MLIAFIATFALLFPLMLVFMQGPSMSAELALGAAFAFAGLFLTRNVRELKRVFPYLGVMVVYLASAYYWLDAANDLSARYTLGLICYLIPAGLFLRKLVDRGQGGAVLVGTALFSLCLAAVGLEVLRTVGVENIVKTVGLDLSRSNVDSNSFTFLHYFTIVNVIIGMSTFAICALAGSVALFLNVPVGAKIVVALGFCVALYTNVQVLTRGAVVSAGLGVFCAFPLVAVNMGARRFIRYSLVGICLFGGLAAYALTTNGAVNEKAHALLQRISETGDDTRLLHWHEAAGIIQHNLLGGGRRFMQTHTWAHNLFLDTALSTGIPGLISVALCLFLAFARIARVLLQGRRELHPIFVVFLAQFLAVFVLCMTSPPNIPLFGFLLLGAGFFASPFTRDDQELV